MEQVEIEMLGLAITFRGTFNTGDILRTDAEFAKHLVDNIKVAKYTKVEPVKSPTKAEIKAKAEAEAKAAAEVEAAAKAEAEAKAAVEVEAAAKAEAEAKAASTKGNGKK